jgi:hypothetical protein
MMMHIQIPEKKKTIYYQLSTAGRTVVGSKGNQFLHEKLVEITMTRQTENTLVFKYKLHNHWMQGSTLMHEWAADMEAVQDELILITDLKGVLISVGNFEALAQKWAGGISKQLAKKYKNFSGGAAAMSAETTKLLADKERFANSLGGFSTWRIFFQERYGPQPEIFNYPFTLPGYFGAIDLPLLVHGSCSAGKETGEIILDRFGALDTARFDRKSFARMLKDLTDVYNADATLTAEMEEQYIFGADGWINEAELFLTTYVNEWYSITSAHHAHRVSSLEWAALNTKMNENKKEWAGKLAYAAAR